MTTKNWFVREFITATKVLIGLTIITCLIQYIFFSNTTWADIKQWIVINSCFNYPFYFANTYLNKYLDKVMPWEANIRRRTILGITLTFLVNLFVIYCVITILSILVFDGPADYAFTANGQSMVLTTLVIVTSLILLFHSIGFFKEVQAEKLLNEQLRKEKVSAELDALKAQIDPHFLFNSFNVLSGLIDEDTSQAQKFLKRLSKIYRHILVNKEENFVSLSEELSFAKEFISLQQVRFEEGIFLNVDVVGEKLQKKVPALSLQLLMENATKHNGFSKENPLRIEVTAHNGHLIVSNNRQERKQLVEGNGMGLENIRRRYQLIGNEGFAIEESEQQFTVKMPLI